ncbi:IL26 protein, partial [Panurus biarmicus]|nr:IL26 protein [Panurus biarmicus]
MKGCSIFRSGHFLFLLCLFAVEGKKSPTGKHTCRKGLLSQVTENLYIKATSLKSSIPKDLIKTTRLLKKTTKMLFMVRFILPLFHFLTLTFLCATLWPGLLLITMPLYQHLWVFFILQLPCAPSTRLTSAVKKLQRMFLKLGDQGIYKAIHELDILLPWIQAYIQT